MYGHTHAQMSVETNGGHQVSPSVILHFTFWDREFQLALSSPDSTRLTGQQPVDAIASSISQHWDCNTTTLAFSFVHLFWDKIFLICSPGWPPTHRNPPVSAYTGVKVWVRLHLHKCWGSNSGLQACMASWKILYKLNHLLSLKTILKDKHWFVVPFS